MPICSPWITHISVVILQSCWSINRCIKIAVDCCGRPISLLFDTRSSAVADKPRDAFVQYAITSLIAENTPLSHVCYHAEFGRSRSNGVGINRSVPKYWDGVVDDSLETRPFRYRAKFGRSWLNIINVRMGIRQKKMDPSRCAFQGHSKLSKLTRIGGIPMTSD